jgi:hypothetical protein
VGPRAVLDAVVKRKIPSPRRQWHVYFDPVSLNYVTYLSCGCNFKQVPCHFIMARPQDSDGDDGPQIRRIGNSMLDKQSLTADKGWYSSLEVGRGLKTSHSKRLTLYGTLHRI